MDRYLQTNHSVNLATRAALASRRLSARPSLERLLERLRTFSGESVSFTSGLFSVRYTGPASCSLNMENPAPRGEADRGDVPRRETARHRAPTARSHSLEHYEPRTPLLGKAGDFSRSLAIPRYSRTTSVILSVTVPDLSEDCVISTRMIRFVIDLCDS